VDAPKAAEAKPGEQAAQPTRVWPVRLLVVPFGHAKHAAPSLVALMAEPYLPAPHGVQDAAPEDAPKKPAAHGEQAVAPAAA